MKLVLAAFITLCILHSGSAIDCYVCLSASNDDCGEKPNTASLVARGAVSSGCGSCTKTFTFMGTVWSNVIRGCSPAEFVSCKNILGHGTCSCTTSFCNGGSSVSYHHAVLLSVTVLPALLSLV